MRVAAGYSDLVPPFHSTGRLSLNLVASAPDHHMYGFVPFANREAQEATIVGQPPAFAIEPGWYVQQRIALRSMLRRVFWESTREGPDVAPTQPAQTGDGLQ